jgi:hypothetical protein
MREFSYQVMGPPDWSERGWLFRILALLDINQ